MIEPLYTPSRVRVIYGAPIDLSLWQGQRKSQELLQALTDELMRKLADLGGVRYTSAADELQPNQPEAPAKANGVHRSKSESL